MYCYMDLTVFDEVDTRNCMTSIDVMNEVLDAVGAGKIAYGDKVLLKAVLKFMYDQQGKR